MANNKIKGLTVEIGGDTTKLGQALESVNKRSGELSSELGEINRLLRFNPDSTELLEQRQKILAETIENTAEKLETLREAEKQVQKQFERGEVSEAQVRALQREIVATEGRLEYYREEAGKAANGTQDLGKEAEKTGGAFEGMGSKVASAAKAGIGAVIVGTTAAVGALVASAEATREYRAEMGKLTTAFETVGHRTEMAQESYKRLQAVIGETDQAVEAAQQIALLAESEEDVIQWSDLAAGVVARFGDALQPETFFEAANETIKLGEATGAYVQLLEGAGADVEEFNEGLAACTTETEKQAYMLKVTEDLLGDAADAYRETNKEILRANEAGEVWMATMAEAGAAVEPILTDVKLLSASLVGELLPGINGITDAFRGLINGEEGSAEALGEALSGLLSKILEMAVEILPALVTTLMSTLTSLVATIIDMLPQLIETGIQITMSILEGITQSIPQIVQAIVDMIPMLVEALVAGIPQLIDGAVQLFMALVDAVPLILPPLIEAIPQIIMAIVNGLLDAIPELIEAAITLLMAIVEAIPVIIDALVPQIPIIVDTIIDGLLANLPLLIDGAIKLFNGILQAIPKICAELIRQAPTIVKSIVEGLLGAIPELIKAGGELMAGLVEGMFSFDIFGAIASLGEAIVDGFKSFFDIHSPSRVMKGLGEMLDAGLAEGVIENASAPVSAIDQLSNAMLDETAVLDGANIERRMHHTFSPNAAVPPTDGISAKLDLIYKAILSGQVIMLDGKALVGSTADRYDTALGQRRVLAERGAL